MATESADNVTTTTTTKQNDQGHAKGKHMPQTKTKAMELQTDAHNAAYYWRTTLKPVQWSVTSELLMSPEMQVEVSKAIRRVFRRHDAWLTPHIAFDLVGVFAQKTDGANVRMAAEHESAEKATKVWMAKNPEATDKQVVAFAKKECGWEIGEPKVEDFRSELAVVAFLIKNPKASDRDIVDFADELGIEHPAQPTKVRADAKDAAFKAALTNGRRAPKKG